MENFIKSIFKTIFSIVICFPSLFGAFLGSKDPDIDFKRALHEQGIDFIGSVVYHLDANLLGGIKTGVVNQGLIDLGLLFHSEKILHYPGGELFVNFQAHVGKNPSFTLTGDLLIFDGMSAPDFVQPSEFWYKQKIQGFSCKIGRVSANLELGFTENAQLFINNAYEALPFLAGYPVYPSAVPGAIFRYDWGKELGLKLGLFNGQESLFAYTRIYPFGIWRDFFKNLLVMAEVDTHFNHRGRLAAGFSYNNTEIFLATGASQKIKYTGYFIGEYNFFDKYCCFVQGGLGNTTVLLFPHYLGLGVQVKQLLPIELENQLALGLASGFFTTKAPEEFGIKGSEISLEATYVLNWGSCTIQPDFQYIIRPGGAGLPNALAFVLNIKVAL